MTFVVGLYFSLHCYLGQDVIAKTTYLCDFVVDFCFGLVYYLGEEIIVKTAYLNAYYV